MQLARFGCARQILSSRKAPLFPRFSRSGGEYSRNFRRLEEDFAANPAHAGMAESGHRAARSRRRSPPHPLAEQRYAYFHYRQPRTNTSLVSAHRPSCRADRSSPSPIIVALVVAADCAVFRPCRRRKLKRAGPVHLCVCSNTLVMHEITSFGDSLSAAD